MVVPTALLYPGSVTVMQGTNTFGVMTSRPNQKSHLPIHGIVLNGIFMTKTGRKNEGKKLGGELRKIIESWLDVYVKRPVFETIEDGILEQARIANILACSRVFGHLIQQKGLPIDIEHLKSLPEQEIRRRIQVLSEYVRRKDALEDETSEEISKIIDDGSQRKYLLLYLDREIHWIAVSILAASYISSLVLIRSLFELVIGIATRKTGGMRGRLQAIEFLSPNEQGEIKATWDELCAWSHPYGKWIEHTCPVFVAQARYHPELCKLCIEKLEKVIDLVLVTAIEKFRIEKQQILTEMKRGKINLSAFQLFLERISSTSVTSGLRSPGAGH